MFQLSSAPETPVLQYIVDAAYGRPHMTDELLQLIDDI